MKKLENMKFVSSLKNLVASFYDKDLQWVEDNKDTLIYNNKVGYVRELLIGFGTNIVRSGEYKKYLEIKDEKEKNNRLEQLIEDKLFINKKDDAIFFNKVKRELIKFENENITIIKERPTDFWQYILKKDLEKTNERKIITDTRFISEIKFLKENVDNSLITLLVPLKKENGKILYNLKNDKIEELDKIYLSIRTEDDFKDYLNRKNLGKDVVNSAEELSTILAYHYYKKNYSGQYNTVIEKQYKILIDKVYVSTKDNLKELNQTTDNIKDLLDNKYIITFIAPAQTGKDTIFSFIELKLQGYKFDKLNEIDGEKYTIYSYLNSFKNKKELEEILKEEKVFLTETTFKNLYDKTFENKNNLSQIEQLDRKNIENKKLNKNNQIQDI